MAARHYEYVIVGAGSTGAAVAYALASEHARNILVIERGSVGCGSDATFTVPVDASRDVGAEPECEREVAYLPAVSGTAVFGGAAAGPSTIKMVITLPPYKTLAEFAEHHGWAGVRCYLAAAVRGRELLVGQARAVLDRPAAQVKRLGSIMVTESEPDALRTEYETLQRLGVRCQWADASELAREPGAPAGALAGIRFPDDAIVDSAAYARALLATVIGTGAAELREGIAVLEVDDSPTGARVRLDDGTEVTADRVIVATGGGFLDANLAGLLFPCFSYLTALPAPGARDSTNWFTFGFSHDWAVCDAWVRVSGEDHFSALKRPRWRARTTALAEWGWARYPGLARGPALTRYGLYSATPDHLPLVGSVRDGARVVYVLGCNAWGQASLSAAAALVPALVGLREFTPAELETAELFSIRRFTSKRWPGSSKL